MKALSGLLELVVIITSAVLIRWGVLSRNSDGAITHEQKRMTGIGLMLLLSWIVLAGIPNFIRSIRDSSELKKFKKNGYSSLKHEFEDLEKQDNENDNPKKKKHRKPRIHPLNRKSAGK